MPTPREPGNRVVSNKHIDAGRDLDWGNVQADAARMEAEQDAAEHPKIANLNAPRAMPSKHLRSRKASFGICGAGYDWPSGVALRNRLEDVTCRNCLNEVEDAAAGWYARRIWPSDPVVDRVVERLYGEPKTVKILLTVALDGDETPEDALADVTRRLGGATEYIDTDVIE